MSKVLEVTPPIRCSPDKFYDFFKNHMSDLLTVFPASFNSVQVLEGENGKVGCVKVWNFVAGITQMIKLRAEAINDAERTITYKAIEGDLMILYKVFQFTIAPGNGVAKWTIVYEKTSELVPPPEIYGVFSISITEVVDLYLLTH
ncbi:MLP 34 [Olea europaea subsp. europaea]|uniref:MLP 34 n=2 Tax=Olea europaea subsp. europaea TaxID=158383 RepID=A0A8S0T5M8_OLEEU|nr:MLP 34 [Olea europaea subsp. europaea]